MKDVPFIWSKACEYSFKKLKEVLTTPPVLTLPDPKYPYIIHTDASDQNVGAVLM